jgi:hypothetical protein
MKAVLAILAISAALAATPAFANIPAQPLPEVGWAGPGHLCEAEFTLRIEAGEFAREDIQLEPAYPASNTIKSPGGWFTVSVLQLKPPKPPFRRAVRTDAQGAVYNYQDDGLKKVFLFLPKVTSRPALTVTFWKDPAVAGPSDDQRSRYASVLNRLTFARTSHADCINPRKA